MSIRKKVANASSPETWWWLFYTSEEGFMSHNLRERKKSKLFAVLQECIKIQQYTRNSARVKPFAAQAAVGHIIWFIKVTVRTL